MSQVSAQCLLDGLGLSSQFSSGASLNGEISPEDRSQATDASSETVLVTVRDVKTCPLTFYERFPALSTKLVRKVGHQIVSTIPSQLTSVLTPGSSICSFSRTRRKSSDNGRKGSTGTQLPLSGQGPLRLQLARRARLLHLQAGAQHERGQRGGLDLY